MKIFLLLLAFNLYAEETCHDPIKRILELQLERYKILVALGVLPSVGSTAGGGGAPPTAVVTYFDSLVNRGNNTNSPAAVTAANTFMVGRNNAGALAAGQFSADAAFEYGGAGGGFKHYLTTTHEGVADSYKNSFRFYLNNSVAAASSSGPAIGNTLAMQVTPVGVGIFTPTTAAPFAALDVLGNITTSNHGNASQNNVLELASKRIGHLSGAGTANDFTGMQLNVTNVDSSGVARVNSSNIGFYTWGNGISLSREVVRITEKGKVGIGTTNPLGALDITSTTEGFLPPRMTKAQRDLIVNPAVGLTIYNIQDTRAETFDGFFWGDPGVNVSNAGAKAAPNAVWTNMNWTTENHDPNNYIFVPSESVTIPRDGSYTLSTTIIWPNTSTVGNRCLRFTVPAASSPSGFIGISCMQCPTSGGPFGNRVYQSISATIYLRAGDLVSVQGFQDSGGQITMGTEIGMVSNFAVTPVGR